ncbi:MAG: GNAT family N-acetyltransferase [Terracidiphilus sp.]
MPTNPHNQSANIELVPAAPDQQSVIANLLQLYLHDFSEFYPLELGNDGRFLYPNLHLYWSEPDRHPFLVKVNGKLAGFVLIKKCTGVAESDVVWDIAEFFILRAYRRQGVGARVAHEIWKKFPGPWEVRVMRSNRNAEEFWLQVVTSFIGAAIYPVHLEKDGERWLIFHFESTPAL